MVYSRSSGAVRMKTMDELVQAVELYAVANYDQKCWDEICECWDEEEIAEQIAGCKTTAEAIARMTEYVDMKYDYIEDIKNS